MTVRPMRPSDQEAINRLHRSVWWPDRSAAGWAWLGANPAARALGAPDGWVVDRDGEAAAFVATSRCTARPATPSSCRRIREGAAAT
jgi:hypothetical protein